MIGDSNFEFESIIDARETDVNDNEQINRKEPDDDSNECELLKPPKELWRGYGEKKANESVRKCRAERSILNRQVRFVNLFFIRIYSFIYDISQ